MTTEYTDTKNTKTEICHNCGCNLHPGEGYQVEMWDYPWDGSDTEGSIQKKLDSWFEEPMSVECLTRACASGQNLKLLRDVATGTDRPMGMPWAEKWRTMARNAYNAHLQSDRELAEAIARGEDGAMRESGFGPIGRH